MPVDRLLHPRIGDSDKIAKLTDMEFRAWIAYILAADDFGVLPMLASKLQGAERSLANRKRVQVDRALVQMVDLGLVRRFDHQSGSYIWSAPWQFHQKIRYPRREEHHYPAPPENELEGLSGNDETEPTRDLFATFHLKVSPAFRAAHGDPEQLAKILEREQKRSGRKRERPRIIPGMDQERSGDVPALTRAGAREEAKANGNGSRLPADGERLDVAFAAFRDAYPENRRQGGLLVQQAYLREVAKAGSAAALMTALVNHKASEQWSDPKVIPGMDTWLDKEHWRRTLEPKGSRPQGRTPGQPAWVTAAKAGGR